MTTGRVSLRTFLSGSPDILAFPITGEVDEEKFVEASFARHLGREFSHVVGCGGKTLAGPGMPDFLTLKAEVRDLQKIRMESCRSNFCRKACEEWAFVQGGG